MKLRIVDNSIRLRLDRSEVRQLLAEGRIERQTTFGPATALVYALHAVAQESALRAALDANRIDVYVEIGLASAWAASEEATLEALQVLGQSELRLSVEKDFPCRHSESQDSAEKFTPTTMRLKAGDPQG